MIAALSAAWLVIWAGSLLLQGIPDGEFVWTVGLLSAWVGYATVLLLRFVVARTEAALASLYYIPVFTFFAALIFDVGVLARAL